MEKFFTPEEVAEALGVKAKTVMEWLRKGELPGIKAGRARDGDSKEMQGVSRAKKRRC